MRLGWKTWLAISLVIISFVLFLIMWEIFTNLRDEEVFLFFEALAFLPIEVLLVILVIDGLLKSKDRQMRLEKMSMVIETFFSETGSELIRRFLRFDRSSKIGESLNITAEWTDAQYLSVKESLDSYHFDISCDSAALASLRDFITQKRQFLLTLLANPNLLEHESFTELLRATFHLIEELISRKDLETISKADREHLEGDIRRAYLLLNGQWLDYMLHLKHNYPYLYSLAVRTNPFDPSASAEIK
jgi:uncharacterized membrane protein